MSFKNAFTVDLSEQFRLQKIYRVILLVERILVERR